MRNAPRTIYQCPPWATMAIVALTTTASGAFLLHPSIDTFGQGRGFAALAGLGIGGFRPDEAAWGAAIFALGVSMWAALVMLAAAVNSPPSPVRRVAFLYNRIVWAIGGILWSGIAASFYAGSPALVATVIIVCAVAIPSLIASVQVRRTVAPYEGSDGGE